GAGHRRPQRRGPGRPAVRPGRPGPRAHGAPARAAPGRDRPGPRRPPTADRDEDFYDLLDASRRALRQREYALALTLIERAAALRPDDRTVAQNLRRLRQLTSRRG